MNLKHLLLTVSALMPASALCAKGPAKAAAEQNKQATPEAPAAGQNQTGPAADGNQADPEQAGERADPSALLQEALYLRDTEQDIPGAIEVLRSVLASQPPAEIALQAQLQLAVCQIAAGQQQEAMTGLETLLKQRMESPASGNQKDDPELAQFMEGLALMESNAMSKVERKELLEAALKGAAQRISPESDFIPEIDKSVIFDQELVGVGAVLAVEEQKIVIKDVVEGSPAEQAGIPKGTVIVKVDGKSFGDLGGKLERVVSSIRGKEGTAVTLLCRLPEANEDTAVQITRKKIKLKEMPVFGAHGKNADGSPNFLADPEAKIISLWAEVFHDGLSDKIREAIESQPEARGLILDLRSNVGGMMEEALKTADLFLTKGVILTTVGPDKQQEQKLARAKGTLPDIPIVVLTDSHTASAAEIVASALQDNKRAVIMGQRTFGQGTVYTLRQVAGKGSIKLPLSLMLRANGAPLQRGPLMTETDVWGVTPDIVLPPVMSGESLKRGAARPVDYREDGKRRDPQWEAALEHLRGMIQPK